MHFSLYSSWLHQDLTSEQNEKSLFQAVEMTNSHLFSKTQKHQTSIESPYFHCRAFVTKLKFLLVHFPFLTKKFLYLKRIFLSIFYQENLIRDIFSVVQIQDIFLQIHLP